MTDTFRLLAAQKKADLLIQVAAFAVTLLLLFYLSVFALYFEALVQVVSAAWWMNRLKDLPQLPVAARYRKAMLIVFVVQLAVAAVPGLNLVFCALMLFAGPVMGISYFVLTMKEMAYYRDARKPYYLL